MERYIKEYANAKIKATKQCELMQKEYKKQIIQKINKALKLRDAELITIDETIKTILEA